MPKPAQTATILTLEALPAIPVGTLYIVQELNKTFVKTVTGWKQTGGSVIF